MKCVVCKRELKCASCLPVWVENTNGSLVKLGNALTPAEAYLCVSQVGVQNVCREALSEGRTYLTDEEREVIQSN